MSKKHLLFTGFVLIAGLLIYKGQSEEKEHAGKEHAGKEHAGKEHAGKEHAGKEEASKEETDKEHAGKEHAGKDEAKVEEKKFNEEEIATAVKDHIKNITKDSKGIFKIKDPKNKNKTLKLKFVKTHPVRFLNDGGYFDCTDFHVKKKKDRIYDLDFWLYPKDGKLEVTKTMIHKHPEKKKGKWEKVARYTFNDKDEMVPVN